MQVRRWWSVVMSVGLAVALLGASPVVAGESSAVEVSPEFPGRPPEGFGEPVAVSPPPGTPFDDAVVPGIEPLGPPDLWEVEQAKSLRRSLGFATVGLDHHFAVSSSDPSSVEALSRASIGVPLDAAEFEEFLRRAAMGDAQADVVSRAQELHGFGGNYIDHPDGGTQVLQFTREADPEAVEALVKGYLYPNDLRIQVVERSASDLVAARDGAFVEMEEAGFTEGVQWALSTDYRRNVVVLEYVAEIEKEAVSVADRFGVETAVFEGYDDEVDCTATTCRPLAGGTNTGGGSSGGCTWGFVLAQGGNLRVSTAGHCASAPGDATRTWNGMTLNRVDWDNAGPVDFAVYEIPTDTWAVNDLYLSDTFPNRFGYQISSYRNPQQGDAVCKRGRSSNLTCGTVLTAAVGEKATADYRSCDGDSGAPVWVASATPYSKVAVGTHTNGAGDSGCPNPPIAGTRRFMRIGYVLSDFGHVVYTASSPRRDFAVSLYDRALGRAPDLSGLTYWQGGSCNAAGLGPMASAFFNGPEFKAIPAVSSVNNVTELSERFYRLYRGVLRRTGAGTEVGGWVNWVYNNAPAYPGGTTTAQRENAYNAAVSFFAGSPEFQSRFTTGFDGEIPLCAT